MSGAGLAAYRTLSRLMPGVLRLLSPGIDSLKTFSELRRNLFQEIGHKLDTLPKPSCRLWVHASSVGEFEQARTVISELKRRRPELDVVVSFLSDSGYEARKNYSEASAVFYHPLDTIAYARRLARMIKPDIFMLMRYDFWPNHLEAIKESGAGMVLAAAALPPGSAYFNPLLKGFYREIFSMFDTIFTVEEHDRKVFVETFGCRNVVQAGDPRFDQVEQRRRDSDTRATGLMPLFDGRNVLVAGSTWSEDESVLLPAWEGFREKLSLVLVPHKVDRANIERLLLDLRQRGYDAVTISSMSKGFDPKKQVLVVDQTGYLAELYTVASMAYVGGAFGVNVHNTIEPAVHGIPVIFGPNYRKSPEAVGLITAGGATVITGTAELRQALARFVENPSLMKQVGALAADFVKSRLGATRIVSDALEKMCRNHPSI